MARICSSVGEGLGDGRADFVQWTATMFPRRFGWGGYIWRTLFDRRCSGGWARETISGDHLMEDMTRLQDDQFGSALRLTKDREVGLG